MRRNIVTIPAQGRWPLPTAVVIVPSPWRNLPSSYAFCQPRLIGRIRRDIYFVRLFTRPHGRAVVSGTIIDIASFHFLNEPVLLSYASSYSPPRISRIDVVPSCQTPVLLFQIDPANNKRRLSSFLSSDIPIEADSMLISGGIFAAYGYYSATASAAFEIMPSAHAFRCCRLPLHAAEYLALYRHCLRISAQNMILPVIGRA